MTGRPRVEMLAPINVTRALRITFSLHLFIFPRLSARARGALYRIKVVRVLIRLGETPSRTRASPAYPEVRNPNSRRPFRANLNFVKVSRKLNY